MLRPHLPSLPLVLLAAAAAGFVSAAEPDANGLFAGLDADGNGRLTAEEVGVDHRMLFKRLLRTGDEDADGLLSVEEFAVALQPVRAEKPIVEKQGSRLPGADALIVMLAKMDANGDRQLAPGEIPAPYRQAFNQMLGPADADQNGRLDRREIARASPRLSAIAQRTARQMGLNVPAELRKLPSATMTSMEAMDAYPRLSEALADPALAARLFEQLDANGDGRLAAMEMKEPFAERFVELVRRGDRDGDKRLSKSEFLDLSRRIARFNAAEPAPTEISQTVRRLLQQFDGNGDQQLAVDEAPPRLARLFARADEDENGRLDLAELTQAAQALSRMRRPAGQRQPRPGK